MNEHRSGINPGFLTKHTLSVCGINENNTKAIVEEIDELPYNFDEMIAIVEKHGAAIKDSWWPRTRLSWQRQTDENIGDNAKHEAHCCNKMPPH